MTEVSVLFTHIWLQATTERRSCSCLALKWISWPQSSWLSSRVTGEEQRAAWHWHGKERFLLSISLFINLLKASLLTSSTHNASTPPPQPVRSLSTHKHTHTPHTTLKLHFLWGKTWLAWQYHPPTPPPFNLTLLCTSSAFTTDSFTFSTFPLGDMLMFTPFRRGGCAPTRC